MLRSLLRISGMMAVLFLMNAAPVRAQGDDQNNAKAPEGDAPPAAAASDIKPDAPGTGGVGDLLVAPTRVVLGGRVHSAEIILHNQGTAETTYRITLIRLRMKENGAYEPVDGKHGEAKPDEKFADDLLRYSPRQVTLKPGESQTVKVMARIEGNLPDGEYRSHLKFEGIPPASMGQDVEAKALPKGQMSIRLIPVFGVSIPIIVRQGELKAEASISDLKHNDKNVSLTLHRSGNKSLYGDVIVSDVHGGTSTVVGEARGVAVFVPNAARTVKVALTAPVSGKLVVAYREREEEGGKTLAEASLK